MQHPDCEASVWRGLSSPPSVWRGLSSPPQRGSGAPWSTAAATRPGPCWQLSSLILISRPSGLLSDIIWNWKGFVVILIMYQLKIRKFSSQNGYVYLRNSPSYLCGRQWDCGTGVNVLRPICQPEAGPRTASLQTLPSPALLTSINNLIRSKPRFFMLYLGRP